MTQVETRPWKLELMDLSGAAAMMGIDTRVRWTPAYEDDVVIDVNDEEL